MKRTLPIVALSSLLALAPAAASAAAGQPEIVNTQWGRAVPRGDFQRSYNDGYQRGTREGERDARSVRPRDYRRHDAFRRGNAGWGSGRGSEDAFRRGFAEGYLAGYDQSRGSRGGWGRPGYPDPGYPGGRYPQGGYGYPDDGYGYPGGGYGHPGGDYGYRGGYGYSPAAQRGYEDGLRDGRNDARDNDRYEPTRKKKYRDGDDGYNNRHGSRDRYKMEYRDAFRQGYDQGYREGRWR